MIYKVHIEAPAINEDVILQAEDEQQAKEAAIYSAVQRQAKAATVTVTQAPPNARPRTDSKR